MNRFIVCLVMLAATALAGCGATDFTEPNDTLKAQDLARQNRGALSPTELPPGLGADLPVPPATMPMNSRQR